MATVTFPVSLLSKSVEERLAYFKDYSVRHPRLLEADAALWRAIHAPVGSPLVFVFGPPGVGKTTLCGRIEQRLTREGETLPAQERRHRATVLLTEAVAPDNSNFNWRDFYQRSLATLEEPFVKDADCDLLPPLNPRLRHALAYNPRLPYCESRLSLEHALRHRRPAAFLIDDAQHIAKIASGRRLHDQMDVLKSLASKSKTLLVLVATYELLTFRNLSGQLSRRSVDIHFRRYGTSKEAVNAFQSVLWAFQRHLPLLVEPDLMKHWEYCYVHTIGCVGILKDWLMRALDDALAENARTITFKTLERHALSVDQCETIAAEALEGEARLTKDNRNSARLIQMLGFTKGSASQIASTASAKTDQKNYALTVKVNPRLPQPVGRRKPRRDSVGAK